MIQLFKDPNYDFISKRKWAYLLSAGFIILGFISIGLKGGLRHGIDFSGGTLIQVRFAEAPQIGLIRSALDRIKLGESVIQEFGDPREFILRLPLADRPAEEITRQVQEALASESALSKTEIRRVEFVGPQVGRDLQGQALYAVLASAAGILIYIAIRFDVKGGVAAIIATFHDVLVTFSAVSLANREISLPVLAAFLTIIGYSVNDTIVAFDRVRENRGKGVRKGVSFAEQINSAINQTLSRTVLTSLTTFMSAVVLLLFGGKALEDFAFVLTVGVVTGTFSTIYVAGAILVDWTAWVEGRAQRAKKAVAKV